jgi:glycosyltransferase involved in cell wall biosynthesis
MSAPPCVSVIMPVFNGERYLDEAVRSILDQTFSDFEFIIIDDGSTDRTSAILKSYTDVRIKVVDQRHQGLVASLNQGLAIARGGYVARMDGDDIAFPHRLEKQVTFLRTHPGTGILGTACRLIDANGRDLGFRQWPINDLEIRWVSLLSSPFGHPTVMICRDILSRNGLKYEEAFQGVEDYGFWTKVLNYTCGWNLVEPLLRYRMHEDSVTSKYREVQLKNHDAIVLRSIGEQLPEFAITPEQVSKLRGLFVGGSEFMPGLDVRRVTLAELYLDMLRAFMSRRHGEPGLERLQRRETLRMARLVLRWPLRPGWMRVIRRLIKLEPGLPWRFSGYLWHAACRRLVPRRNRLKLARDLVAVGTKSGLPAE